MTSVARDLTTMEYGPAPESAERRVEAWLERHGRRFGLFIDGKWVEGEAGESFDDAATRPTASRSAAVAQATTKDVDAAVAAARKALPGLAGARAATRRARYLYALARRLQKHARLFAVLETLDNGKPIRETRDIDIPLVARHFYHHAGWAQLHGRASCPATRRSASSARSSRGTSRC